MAIEKESFKLVQDGGRKEERKKPEGKKEKRKGRRKKRRGRRREMERRRRKRGDG